MSIGGSRLPEMKFKYDRIQTSSGCKFIPVPEEKEFNDEVVENPKTDGKSMTEPFRAFSFPFVEDEKEKEFKPGPNTYSFHLDRVEAEKTNPCLEVPEMELCPVGREKSVQDQVIDDMIERAAVGMERYGKELHPFNGRNMLKEMYEEIQDSLIYLRTAMSENEIMIEEIKDLYSRGEELSDSYVDILERGLNIRLKE